MISHHQLFYNPTLVAPQENIVRLAKKSDIAVSPRVIDFAGVMCLKKGRCSQDLSMFPHTQVPAQRARAVAKATMGDDDVSKN